MVIRRARERDLADLAILVEQAAGGLGPEIFCRDSRDYLAAHLAGQGFILVAEDSGALCGMMMARFPYLAEDNLGWDLAWSEERLKQVCHMESLAVHPYWRGQGLQRALLSAAESKTAEMYRYWLATVAPANGVSLRNFYRMGYAVVAQKKKYGGYDRYILLKNRP